MGANRTVVVTPSQVRSYARDSVRSDMDMVVHGGLTFRLVIYGSRAENLADTVYRSLSFRDWVQLGPQLRRPDEETTTGGVRVRGRVRRP